MFRKIFWFVLAIVGTTTTLTAQELYVFTEPASNMPSNSIGVRLTNEGMINPEFRSRTMGEVMVGLNKNLMVHGQAFLSDMDGKYRLDGAAFYAKYRFLSLDDEQSHFRAAAYAKVAMSKRRAFSEDVNLGGDNSGIQGGLVLTQLIHKLALSGTVGYSKAFNRDRDVVNAFLHMPMMADISEMAPNEMINYSLSSGYLMLPFVYKNYNQPNFNLYFEVLGKTNPENGHSYLDLAPAVQLIINSRTRFDLGYRFQVAGNMYNRYMKNMYLARVEFNFFNALNKKS
ncbi:MAG: hypothetical protein EOO87_03755 [Pedobacter sp.]|nr:MAG: hypothetical protein EOO87_03755 [Pedobacter sp.]